LHLIYIFVFDKSQPIYRTSVIAIFSLKNSPKIPKKLHVETSPLLVSFENRLKQKWEEKKGVKLGRLIF
jgi:hypothetical protein